VLASQFSKRYAFLLAGPALYAMSAWNKGVNIAPAFAGAIGFVGLMAPHIARKLVGSAFGGLVPAAALVGGIIVMAADLIGRTCFAPFEVAAGVFTAIIGAPYFIYLLYRSRHS